MSIPPTPPWSKKQWTTPSNLHTKRWNALLLDKVAPSLQRSFESNALNEPLVVAADAPKNRILRSRSDKDKTSKNVSHGSQLASPSTTPRDKDEEEPSGVGATRCTAGIASRTRRGEQIAGATKNGNGSHLSRETVDKSAAPTSVAPNPKKRSRNGTPKNNRTTSDKKYECIGYEGCSGKSFKDLWKFKRHIDSVHRRIRYECTEYEGCTGKTFGQRDHLNAHINTFHRGVRYQCPISGCGSQFRRQWSLKAHLNGMGHGHHSTESGGVKKYPCTYCANSYASRNGLHVHVKWVHQGVTYLCPQPGCSSVYRQRSGLRRHINRCHGGATSDMPYACASDKCGMRFQSQGALSIHTTTMHA